MPSLLWLQTGACSGDSMSLLDAEGPDLAEALDAAGLELLWHPSLTERPMSWLHRTVEEIERGERPLTVLAVEGSILTGPDGTGRYDVMFDRAKKDVVEALAARAEVVVAMGTCAAFGGIPASGPNPTDAVGLQFLREDPEGGLLPPGWRSARGLPVINVPGCPAHPATMLQTLRGLLAGRAMPLDHLHRPEELYRDTVHQGCTRNEHHEFDVEDRTLGGAGCLFYNLGCQGPSTMGTCNVALWNGVSSKMRVGVPCVGCTSPAFPRPGALFSTEKVGEVPVHLPLGVNRARYLSYKGLARDAAPARLKGGR